METRRDQGQCAPRIRHRDDRYPRRGGGSFGADDGDGTCRDGGIHIALTIVFDARQSREQKSWTNLAAVAGQTRDRQCGHPDCCNPVDQIA